MSQEAKAVYDALYFPAPSSRNHTLTRPLEAGREGGGDGGLVSEEAMRKLRDTTELDYLTHVVFRMYENKRCVRLP